MLDLELTGKHVVITGGASNIGRGIAFGFAEQGVDLTLIDIDAEQAEQTARDAVALGARACRVVAADLGDPERCSQTIHEIEADIGAIDVLINNVGWGRPALFLNTDAAHWERMWRLNLGTTVGCTHAALEYMRKRRRGNVVSIASDAAKGEPNQAVYGAMKAGVVSLTRALAVEFGRYNVRLNAIAPGLIMPTNAEGVGSHSLWRQDNMFNEQQLRTIEQSAALKRFSTPRDIANAALVFASDVTGRQLTGQLLSVSGGYWMP